MVENHPEVYSAGSDDSDKPQARHDRPRTRRSIAVGDPGCCRVGHPSVGERGGATPPEKALGPDAAGDRDEELGSAKPGGQEGHIDHQPIDPSVVERPHIRRLSWTFYVSVETHSTTSTNDRRDSSHSGVGPNQGLLKPVLASAVAVL